MDIDYAFYYMSFFNRVPVVQEQTPKGLFMKRFLLVPTEENLAIMAAAGPTQEDLTLKAGHNRVNAFGVDFEIVAGLFGLRGEVGYLTDMPYTRESDFAYINKDIVSGGLGIDYTTENNLYWNLQVSADLIMDYEKLYGADELTPQAALNLSRDFLLGDLLFDLAGVVRLNDGDWMIRPEFRYKFGGGFEMACGGFWIGGDPDTLFGRYDTKDLIYAEAKYWF